MEKVNDTVTLATAGVGTRMPWDTWDTPFEDTWGTFAAFVAFDTCTFAAFAADAGTWAVRAVCGNGSGNDWTTKV
jgi:hypothetical protein